MLELETPSSVDISSVDVYSISPRLTPFLLSNFMLLPLVFVCYMSRFVNPYFTYLPRFMFMLTLLLNI